MNSSDSKRPLRVAFVGAGQMAGVHLRALPSVRTPHAIVGVMDAREGAARQLAETAGCAAYTSLERMLEETRPEVVHVVTPAGRHLEPAEQALRGGAHVYVEKPFVETAADARALLATAEETGRLVCAGHQLLRQPAYAALVAGARELTPLVLADSVFCFRSPTVRLHRAGPSSAAAQLLDILPHPLYTLIHALESLAAPGTVPRLTSLSTSPTEISAELEAGAIRGRLLISLRARPVQSTLVLAGERGALTCDFVHGVLLGAGNAGAGPLEKMLNPIREGGQRMTRSAGAIAKRLLQGGAYPGLVEILEEFYSATAHGGMSPTSPLHLRTVTDVYERIAAEVRRSVPLPAPPRVTDPERPLIVLTGARGFLGREVANALADAGCRVRGLSRGSDPDLASVTEWVRTDLSSPVDPQSLAGAAAVIHAAAETSGGFEQHARNSVAATRELLSAMAAAGVRRLIYVSSVSVLEVPRAFETQDETAPLAAHSERLGPYTWGKTEAERIVQAEGQRLGLRVTIVRPGALMDWRAPTMPGQLGRQLYGPWHLGLGRGGLPIGVIGVDETARILAWMALRQDDAPPIVNLNDDRIRTRREALDAMRARGWRGRVVWVPISVIAFAFTTVRTLLALKGGRLPTRMDAFGVLRARRFDPARSAEVRQKADEFFNGLATVAPEASRATIAAGRG